MGSFDAMGAREVGHGIAILTQPRQRGTCSGRGSPVTSVDLALLGSALSATSHKREPARALPRCCRRTAVDVLCARESATHTATRRTRDRGESRAMAAITVNRPIEQVFAFWRSLDNVPQFMRYFDSGRGCRTDGSAVACQGPGGVSRVGSGDRRMSAKTSSSPGSHFPDCDVDNRGTVQVPAGAGRAGHGGPCGDGVPPAHGQLSAEPSPGSSHGSLAAAERRPPPFQAADRNR